MPESGSIDNIEYSISRAQAVKLAALLRALGHPLRLQIVARLLHQECNVKRMTECLGTAQATISQQLAVLRAAGVVTCERKGNQVCYRVVRPWQKLLVRLLTHITEEE